MKKLILFVVLLALSACEKAPLSVEHHGEYEVQLLFEKDGCKMYRFNDGGRNIYWSNCSGNTSTTYRSGKATHYSDVYTTTK